MRNDEILNQASPLVDHDPFESDRALVEGLRREGGESFAESVRAFATLCGDGAVLRLGELANRHVPELHTHDRFGHRLDKVDFHPAWHALMQQSIEAGVHSLPWEDPVPGAHVARTAMMMLRHQVDEGSSCPLTMTFAVVPSLRLQPDLAEIWEPRVLSRVYDPSFQPAENKSGALFGMAMTERQGGSDVRANTTRATRQGDHYRLDGHKWFCSAPMCDAFLVLAQTGEGLGCFLLPRWLPDGTRNAIRIVRLKEKLGNRSNASSEIELEGASAWLVGEEGRGVATIIEMVRHTRLDCASGSAATLRRALAEALHHASERHAFGKPLIEQPLMQSVLADLALESEAATALALRLARSFDRSEESAFSRIATAIGKYWITRRAIVGVAEALEVMGGNGYVESGPMARLYRDVPLNSIWEGSGNIQCLDVLRAAAKQPETLQALFDEIELAQGDSKELDRHVEALRNEKALDDEARARGHVERLALALQGSLLLRHSPFGGAFVDARLGPARSLTLGALPGSVDRGVILARARVQ